jgi:sulfur-carrier protein
LRLLYFASVRQHLGKGEEVLSLPADITTAAALASHLAAMGPTYGAVFNDLRPLRVAINQVHARFDDSITDGDEVAFFPPVTGG